MSAPDLINGALEAGGGLMVLDHCRATLRDKDVAGVSIPSVIFFVVWGLWNLFFYPHLGQVWSLAGAIVIVCANATWVALLIRYRKGA